MMKWYEDPVIREWMKSNDINEEQQGRWASHNRTFQDFNGGMVVTTTVLIDDPRFDVQTVHETRAGEDTLTFLGRCIVEHSEEIRRRTLLLRERGPDSIKGRDPGTN